MVLLHPPLPKTVLCCMEQGGKGVLLTSFEISWSKWTQSKRWSLCKMPIVFYFEISIKTAMTVIFKDIHQTKLVEKGQPSVWRLLNIKLFVQQIIINKNCELTREPSLSLIKQKFHTWRCNMSQFMHCWKHRNCLNKRDHRHFF